MLLAHPQRYPYNPQLNARARRARKQMTKSEQLIWFNCLQPLQKCYATRIHKQRIIGNYIVDFYIPKIKLVIEIDGESHFSEEAQIYDQERTGFLEGLGLSVIRFTNDEVKNNLDAIYSILHKKFEQH